VLLAGPETAAPAAEFTWEPAVCSQRSGAQFGGSRSLIAMESVNPQGTSIVAALHDCVSVTASVIGPGCGTKGGKASASCGGAGGALFTHVLSSARPAALVYLAVGTAANPPQAAPCPCVLVPVFPSMIPAYTSATGSAAIPAQVPPAAAVMGLTLYDQWVVTNPTAKCKTGYDLSTALRVTIE
jgi:hypothetical protein